MYAAHGQSVVDVFSIKLIITHEQAARHTEGDTSRQTSTVVRKKARFSSGAPAILFTLSKQHGWPHVTCQQCTDANVTFIYSLQTGRNCKTCLGTCILGKPCSYT